MNDYYNPEDSDNPYVILEINHFSSTEEIKKSYRRLCLKYHPDKCGGDSEQFIRVQNAYDKLMKEKDTNINFFIVFLYFLYSSSFSTPQDITLTISVPIEDVYNNRIKKISYTRFDSSCKKVTETVYLELAGWRESYTIDDFGDYHPFSGRCGNLVINVNIKNEDKYKHIVLNLILNKYDLYTTINVDLYEYLFGVDKPLLYFNDEEIRIRHTPRVDGDVYVIANKGLCKDDDTEETINDNKKQGLRGDLYVFFNLDMKHDGLKTSWNEIEEHRELFKKLFHE